LVWYDKLDIAQKENPYLSRRGRGVTPRASGRRGNRHMHTMNSGRPTPSVTAKKLGIVYGMGMGGEPIALTKIARRGSASMIIMIANAMLLSERMRAPSGAKTIAATIVDAPMSVNS
jgi:hypothetical protein